jgi:hypothetical protein
MLKRWCLLAPSYIIARETKRPRHQLRKGGLDLRRNWPEIGANLSTYTITRGAIMSNCDREIEVRDRGDVPAMSPAGLLCVIQVTMMRPSMTCRLPALAGTGGGTQILTCSKPDSRIRLRTLLIATCFHLLRFDSAVASVMRSIAVKLASVPVQCITVMRVCVFPSRNLAPLAGQYACAGRGCGAGRRGVVPSV